MAAEDKPQGVEEPFVSIDSDDLAGMIRGDVAERQEPDVRVGDESFAIDDEPAAPARAASQPATDDRLTAALASIDDLRQRNAQLEGRFEEASRSRTRQAEPEIEMVEVPGFGGMRIPKNPENRPIRLTEDMARAVGLDPSAAAPLEILGNTLYMYLADQFPRMSVQAWEQAQNLERRAQGRKSQFYDAYADLREFDDLRDIVERGERARGAHLHFKTIEEYDENLARATRSRIAAMRGVTVDQYEAGLPRETRQNVRQIERPRSRAISPSGSSRSRGAAVSARQQEIDDL